MVDFETFRKIALSFPDAEELPHFHLPSFRIKKKIFATYDGKRNRACIKLSEIDQDVFSAAGKAFIYPVDNKWGRQGWTIIEMQNIRKDIFIDALTTAYCEVAPENLANQIRPD